MKGTSMFKHRRSCSGVSSIIGAIFLVAIMIFTALNVYLWAMTQYTFYNDVIRERNQLDIDRLTERLDVATTFTVEANTITINATVKNPCPLAIRIIRVWVVDATIHRVGHTALNVNLAAGQTATVVADVTIPGAGAADAFNSWFVTERGNAFFGPPKEVFVAEVAGGLGKIALDMDHVYRYNVIDSPYKVDFATEALAFTAPYGEDLAFKVFITNLDPEDRVITLTRDSCLFVTFPVSPPALYSAVWYIVNVAPDGTIANTYTNITIPWGETVEVWFASGEPVVSSFTPSLAKYTGVSAVTVLLTGSVGPASFGQNIPFITTTFYP